MIGKLTETQCRTAIARGEFADETRKAAPHTAIVLSQSWCPQCMWMRGYLDAIAAVPDVAIFWVEYDRESFFDDFREFKENVFGNFEIPYVRYYRDGILIRESNYVDKSGFAQRLGVHFLGK
ncbi:MAG: hypothetical protein WAZ99_07415 [Rectinemataceae bacterium]